jgi:MFS family permease
MTAAAPSRSRPPQRERLLTTGFRQILGVTFLAFGAEAIVRALVPLLVLARGGDAVLVGLVATAYSLPSLLFRPIVGSLVDSWQHKLLYRGGALFGVLIPSLLLIPAIPVMMVARFLTGTAWGFFSVSNHSLMAKLAPPNRRAEASGIFMTMPAAGQLLLPALGVAIYTSTGHEAWAIALAMTMFLCAFLITTRMHVPPAPPRPASADTEKVRLWERFVEPSALGGTAMLVLSFSSWSIFTVFPSVYLLRLGEPLEVLVWYLPVFGLAQAISQPVFGRVADRLGRMQSMILGSTMGFTGLLACVIPASVAPPMLVFAVGSFIYALGQSFVNPTISALVMERAPRHRLGSAMATYSIGYQFATGTSSVLWGAIITGFGFTWLFLVAAGFQVLTALLSRRLLASKA